PGVFHRYGAGRRRAHLGARGDAGPGAPLWPGARAERDQDEMRCAGGRRPRLPVREDAQSAGLRQAGPLGGRVLRLGTRRCRRPARPRASRIRAGSAAGRQTGAARRGPGDPLAGVNEGFQPIIAARSSRRVLAQVVLQRRTHHIGGLASLFVREALQPLPRFWRYTDLHDWRSPPRFRQCRAPAPSDSMNDAPHILRIEFIALRNSTAVGSVHWDPEAVLLTRRERLIFACHHRTSTRIMYDKLCVAPREYATAVDNRPLRYGRISRWC